MSVMQATVRRPLSLPISTISRASSRASASVFMKAPPPHFTSSTMTSAPAASFLDMMLLTMRGMERTVPVTSRRA